MSTKNDGGPAFPMPAAFSPECGTTPGQTGMTLRDWFAGQVANGDAAADTGWMSGPTAEMVEKRVELYYQIAAAMLARRSVP